MSAVVDAGDALELTFSTATGSSVRVSWYDDDMVPRYEDQNVPEVPSGSGRFPVTLVPDAPGMWKATFIASGASTAVEDYWVRATSRSGLAPLAAVGDVGAQYGPMTAAQEQLAAWLLKQASMMVRSRPLFAAGLASGKVSRDMAALAVTNMVLRVLRNPNGLRSETVGPFSRAYDIEHAAGLLVISPDEEGILDPGQVAGGSSAIGSAFPHAALSPVPIRRGWSGPVWPGRGLM